MENKFFRLKKIKAQVKQFAPVLFLVIALGLVGIGVSKNPYLIKTKIALADAFVPIVAVVTKPIDWVKAGVHEVSNIFKVHALNKKLMDENEQLIAWKNIAYKLAADKKELEKQLNYVPSKDVSYLTARVVADNGGNFSKSLLVQAGADNGVKKGALAMLPQGLFGRVVEAGNSISRLLLLTDFSSRIPVMVGEERLLCILTGDNSDFPKLISLPEGEKPKIGDRVVTSGHAGVFPSGLGIGIVSAIEGGEVYVTPFTHDLNPEFVRLVDFGLSGVLVDEKPCQCEQQQ